MASLEIKFLQKNKPGLNFYSHGKASHTIEQCPLDQNLEIKAAFEREKNKKKSDAIPTDFFGLPI